MFLETINHPNVFYSTKSKPILNDITMEDAKYIGIDSVARVVSNGYDAPSTILEKPSDEFLDIFYSADLIISKDKETSRDFGLSLIK